MEVSGGIALLILILQLDVVICQRHPLAAFPHEIPDITYCIWGWVGVISGLDALGKYNLIILPRIETRFLGRSTKAFLNWLRQFSHLSSLFAGEWISQRSLHVHSRERARYGRPLAAHQRHRAASSYVHSRAPQTVPEEARGDNRVALRRCGWGWQSQAQNRLVEGERLPLASHRGKTCLPVAT